jgi:hypothetical protein
MLHLFVPIRIAELSRAKGLSKFRVSLATSSGALEANLGLELWKLNGRGLDCGLIASNRLKGFVSVI